MTYSAATANSVNKPAFGRNQNTTYFKTTRGKVGPISNIIVLTFIICLMGLIYLTQVTKTYGLGYKVNDLTVKQEKIANEHANLELESVKLRSIEKVKTSQANAALTSVSPTSYAQ